MLSIRQLIQSSPLRQGVRSVNASAVRAMSDGRMFSDEERAKETQYIRKMEAEKIEKAKKEAAAALKKLEEKHQKAKEEQKK